MLSTHADLYAEHGPPTFGRPHEAERFAGEGLP